MCGEAEGWCPLSLSLVFTLWLLPPRWRVAAAGLGGWERKTFLSAFCFPLSRRTSLSKENIPMSPVCPHLRVGDKPDASLALAHMGAPSHGHQRPRGHSAPHWDASTGQEGVRRSQACSTCDGHGGGGGCVPLQKLHLASPGSLTFDDLFLGGIQLYFHFSSAEFTQPSPQICLGRRDAGDREMGTPCRGGRGGGGHHDTPRTSPVGWFPTTDPAWGH